MVIQKGKNSKPFVEFSKEVGHYSNIAVQIAISTVAFLLLGWWGDQKLGTTPWLMIGGIFFAIASVALGLIKLVKSVSASPSKNRGKKD